MGLGYGCIVWWVLAPVLFQVVEKWTLVVVHVKKCMMRSLLVGHGQYLQLPTDAMPGATKVLQHRWLPLEGRRLLVQTKCV